MQLHEYKKNKIKGAKEDSVQWWTRWHGHVKANEDG